MAKYICKYDDGDGRPYRIIIEASSMKEAIDKWYESEIEEPTHVEIV